MGKVSKGVKCSVIGCEKEATRSLPINKVTKTGLKVQGTRRVYLCKDHYKEYKKATKKEKMLDKWRYKSRIS
ncbi:hypothetical protein B6U79_00900 [Candidatus Bathyarchaeota archaeon ex4484_231]|nr:MAG: hypothetical protein B6U79_00900 [Candidatus Bathyarchaeota archaeon ex4484_231]RJS75846.1 MAG: hypothetical protein CW712_03330 [Candidatus Bathyarchaeota archaeon]